MGKRRKSGRQLDGVVVIDKPAGDSSNGVLQRVKRLFYANKAGHTGALDPLATGVLPICFGEATKFSQFLLDADKEYLSTFRFGEATDTADSDGEVVEKLDASRLSEKDVEAAIKPYLGDIEQVPPMYSALKRDGQPLYKLARQGIEVEREPRPVTIYEFELIAFRSGEVAEADVRVFCSKGTYIRSLAADIGYDLGVGGHVAQLRRTQAGPFSIDQSVSVESLDEERGENLAETLDHHLLPVDIAVQDFPSLELDDNSAFYFSRGQSVMDSRVYRLGDEGDKVRVFDSAGKFYGVAEITDEGTVAPKRLISQS